MSNPAFDFGTPWTSRKRLDPSKDDPTKQDLEIRRGVLDQIPVSQISTVFAMQSYNDSTRLENALLVQNPNDPIVNSTNTSAVNLSLKKEQQPRGQGLALHPSSQTPVAVVFKSKTARSSSAIILVPGQVVFPYGDGSMFDGFQFGLPFGWLGGGLATLIVLPKVSARPLWTTSPIDVVFHRVTIPFVTTLAALTPRVNWPTRFPWRGALQGAGKVNQAGGSQMSVSQTRVQMTLRGVNPLAAPATMKAIYYAMDQQTNVNDVPSNATFPPFEEYTWPNWVNPTGGSVVPTQMVLGGISGSGVLASCSGNGMTTGAAALGSVTLYDDNSGTPLSTGSVDMVRWGRL